MGVGVGVIVGTGVGVAVGVSVGVAARGAQALISKMMSNREAVILVIR
jgi:hypothetical protein